MKIHRRKVALLIALLTAIGLATLPLEGAAILLRYMPEPPPPAAQSGDPDTPYGRTTQASPNFSRVKAGRIQIWFYRGLSPIVLYRSPTAGVAPLKVAGHTR